MGLKNRIAGLTTDLGEKRTGLTTNGVSALLSGVIGVTVVCLGTSSWPEGAQSQSAPCACLKRTKPSERGLDGSCSSAGFLGRASPNHPAAHHLLRIL